MARNSIDITIDAEGRDQNKVFRLTEMPARQAEEWALRAFMGMARSGIEIPDDISSAGLPGLAILGFRAFASMRYDDAKPLLEEMFSCVKFVTSKNIVRDLVDTDTEEIATRLKLRKEVFELHTGFFAKGANLKSQTSAPVQAAKDTQAI